MSLIDQFVLVNGIGNRAHHEACLMSAQSVLDGREFGDEHPSLTLRAYGIHLNDNFPWSRDAHRTIVFRPILNSGVLCASTVTVTPKLELRRAFKCADVACRQWAPRALYAAGYPDQAARLRALDPIVDEKTAHSAAAECEAAWSEADAGAGAAAKSAAAAALDAATSAKSRVKWVASGSAANTADAAANTAARTAEWLSPEHADEVLAEALVLLIDLAEMRD